MALLLYILLAGAPTPALAQQALPPAPTDSAAEPRPRGVLPLVAHGALAGAVGAGLGYALADAADETAGPLGLFVGHTVAVPLGVHWGNRRRGRVVPVVLASAGASLGGALLASAFEDQYNPEVTFYLFGSALQIATAVLVERASSRRTR